ncbi:hypothetical protein [Microvirga sp. VF16]|uniref:hypothetical protein n=1 Tax=Microvirga sp. VF16 TaxID=2807101 RepID=UPI00193CF835|nr:hypothetical protein [Microvirga sp. VF16]QRM34846.1 hypothetical protein JO965_42050 [Microvirga sp. VF16]
MTTYASQALVWARSRSLQSLKAKLDAAPVLAAVVAFLVFAFVDLIFDTSLAFVFMLLIVVPAAYFFVSDRLRPSPVQKRLGFLASSSFQRFVSLAEITVEPPLVAQKAGLLLMIDRRSRQVSERMEVYRLIQEGSLKNKFLVPSTIRFHRDGIAEIEISRNDLNPVKIRIDLRRGLNRVTLRETVPDEKNPYVNQVRRYLLDISLDSIAEIRRARIKIAQFLKVDTCPAEERPNRTAAMAFANNLLDSRKKELFGQ